MKQWLGASEIAGLPGLPGTQRRVSERAKREGWNSRKRQGRGGGLEFDVSCLPEAARTHLAAQSINASKASDIHAIAGGHEGRRHQVKHSVDQAILDRNQLNAMKGVPSLDENSTQRMDAKLAILNALEEFKTKAQISMAKARESFPHVYASRMACLDESVYEIVPHVSASSLANWQAAKKSDGITSLAGNYGNRKGTSKVDTQPALKQFIVAMLTEFPHASAAQIMKGIKARLGELKDMEIPSKRSLERWLNKWKAENKEVFTAVTSPDQWKSDYMVAYGSRSDGIKFPNQMWEVDATPADIMLADGRYSLSGVIDICTRRLKLLVTRTPKAEAHCLLLRRAILDWGVPDLIKHDGGMDYVAKRMMRAFDGLDIDSHKCNPFSPWEKPHIERSFRTFSHDLVELLQGYIGHNVSDRKDIEDRKAFSERLFKKDGTIELKMTADQFQQFCDNWTENVYHQQPHSSLGNKTPFQVAAESRQPIKTISDERVLDLLLADAPGDGYRTVTKKGLKIDKVEYIAPELAEFAGERVRVLLDPIDMGRIYVYSDLGFICIAENPELSGVSRQEVAEEAKRRQRAKVSQARKELKSAARKEHVSDIAQEIVASKATETASLISFPAPTIIHTSEGIDAAADAIRATDTERDLPAAAITSEAKIIELMSQPKVVDLAMMSDSERWDYWGELHLRHNSGDRMSEDENRFYEAFRNTSTWKAFRAVNEDLEIAK